MSSQGWVLQAIPGQPITTLQGNCRAPHRTAPHAHSCGLAASKQPLGGLRALVASGEMK